jgi:pyruvate/2-oxoacid:ferredoxin oxidoreductase alpha subunit
MELLKGNVALAEAAIRAGCEAYFGYPITPQTELLEHMAQRMPELGRVFIQAESEVAAINMVYGAACTGARAMTSSSTWYQPDAGGFLVHRLFRGAVCGRGRNARRTRAG